MTTTTEYPPVDWTKPIMLEGHGTLLRHTGRVEYSTGLLMCEPVEGAWPDKREGPYWVKPDGTFPTLGYRVVNVPETPDLSQEAAEVCARLANVEHDQRGPWSAKDFDKPPFPICGAFRRTIELCLKHLDTLPDELREHIRPLSDDERVLRKAREWAARDDPSYATAFKSGEFDDQVAVTAYIAGHKAAQS